jgi:hypothetical protein
MNIFAVHIDPREAAKCLGDQHVVKMILESTQMLYVVWHTAEPGAGFWRELEAKIVAHPVSQAHGVERAPAYRPTHKNHPCAVWLRESRDNYEWLVEHALEMCAEKRRRWPSKKPHKSEAHITELREPPPELKSVGLTPFPLAVADDIKARYVDKKRTLENCVQAYRDYYREHKKTRYTGTAPPLWLDNA